jgi:cell division protein FtsL
VAVAVEPRRERTDASRRRPQLRVVDAPVPRRRLMVFGAGAVAVLLFGSLFALAAFHTLIVQGQLKMDRLDRSIGKAQADRTELRFLVADLSSPQRILDAAARLEMVQPQDPVYLQPVIPGGAVKVPAYSASLTAKRVLTRPVVATTTLVPAPTTTVSAPTTTVAVAKTQKAAK